MLKTLIEGLIGRHATEEELSLITWLDGYDDGTKQSFLKLMKASFEHGREFEKVWPGVEKEWN